MYHMICNAMEYYGYRTTNDDPFDMAANAYGAFLKDAKLVDDKRVTTEVAQRIFVQVNVEIGGDRKLNAANDDNALMRHEFVEAIFRLTAAKYDLEARSAAAPDHAAEFVEDALHSMLRDHLLHLPWECLHDSDAFRTELLYTEAVDGALLKHRKVLRDLYDVYSALAPTAGRHNFRPQEWNTFLEVGGVFSNNGFSKPDALYAFIFSRMRHLDETQPRFRSLTWVSFLEAIVRVAAAFPLPSEASMRGMGATQLAEFYEHLTHHVDAAGGDAIAKIRACLEDDRTRPLHDRVALLLVYVLQNHAIKYRGVMKTKTSTLKLNYLTEPQKQRWLTVNATRTRRVDVESRANDADKKRPRSREGSPAGSRAASPTNAGGAGKKLAEGMTAVEARAILDRAFDDRALGGALPVEIG